MLRLLRRLWRWLGFGSGPMPQDLHARMPVPAAPRRPQRSAAVALAEPDEEPLSADAVFTARR